MAANKKIVIGKIYSGGPWAPCNKVKFDPVNYGVICVNSVKEPSKPRKGKRIVSAECLNPKK